MKKVYTDEIMKVAAWYLIVGGRKVYETLALNLPFPSISRVYNYIYDKDVPAEGMFYFKEFGERLKKTLEKTDLETDSPEDPSCPMFAYIAEDDTKIVSALDYVQKTDTISGFCLPLDENGVPVIDFYKFSSVAVLKKYLDNVDLSAYAKVVTAKPMKPDGKTFILTAYGTKGSDKADQVHNRWNFIEEEFKKENVHVMGKHYHLLTYFSITGVNNTSFHRFFI